MTCAPCKVFVHNDQYAMRPCSKCNSPQPVCWSCGDGKASGAVSFNHGCGGQLELGGGR